jgi:hypothetical protein
MPPACEKLIPDYAAKNSANYAAWRAENLAKVEAAEADPEFGSKQAEILKRLPSMRSTERSDMEKSCRQLSAVFDVSGAALEVEDPRFSSPEKTWEVFLSSLRRADRDAVMTCLVGKAKTKFEEWLNNWMTRTSRGRGTRSSS